MENPMKRFDVVVVGAGYVGLVTGATLSHLGHRVTCVDRDEERIRALKSGRLPFYEPNLEELVSLGVSAERLSFVDPAGLASLLGETAVLFIAVDTPQNGDGSASLSSVAAIARDIGRSLSEAPLRKRPLLVVNKSTVPVGSGDYVSTLIQEGLEEAGGGRRERPVSSWPLTRSS
jgi:UDPglucose 6-dehydrogenase